MKELGVINSSSSLLPKGMLGSSILGATSPLSGSSIFFSLGSSFFKKTRKLV